MVTVFCLSESGPEGRVYRKIKLLMDLSMVFSSFDWDKLAKICQYGCMERTP